LVESFKVGVVGTGYVGLVTGTCLSYFGHRVVCIDRDEGRIGALKAGRMPFYEPGLEELVSRSLEQQRLSFADSGSLARHVGEAEVIFVAVDTPQGEDGSADLSNVADVARDIGWALARPESPVGSARSWWSTRAQFRSDLGTTSRCSSARGSRRLAVGQRTSWWPPTLNS
jgi:UDPglucose 6-dehydrogenase